MVFIEERHKYFESLAGQPKQMALLALLFGRPLSHIAEDISDTDAIYYSSIQAIQNNLKENFNKQYLKISKRKIIEKTTAPFVHDDFLIFTLVLGVIKFKCDKEWILCVIRNRAKNAINATFENLLNDNFQSRTNIQSLVLVVLSLLGEPKITNETLIEAYEMITNVQQTHNNDFVRIIQYRAFDLIIQFKLPRDEDEVSRLLVFEKRFKKRAIVFTYLVYNTFLLFILFAVYRFLHNLPEDWKSKINEIAVILGVAGIGLFGNAISKLQTIFQNLVLRLFGFHFDKH